MNQASLNIFLNPPSPLLIDRSAPGSVARNTGGGGREESNLLGDREAGDQRVSQFIDEDSKNGIENKVKYRMSRKPCPISCCCLHERIG